MNRSNDVVLLQRRLAERRQAQQPHLTEDQFFLVDCADGLLREYDPTVNQIEDGIVDGADDGGIDAVYVGINGQLIDESDLITSGQPAIDILIIQAKNEAGFAETPLQKLIDHLPVLLDLEASDDTLGLEFNADVVERFGLIRRTWLELADKFPIVDITVAYAAKADGDPNGKVTKKAERLCERLSEIGLSSVRVEFVGAKRLNELAQARTPLTLQLKLNQTAMSSPRGGLIALVPLPAYFEFITTDDGVIRESIFEENVRGFEGQTNINRAISATLKKGPSDDLDFWWLNNGVTVTARQVNNQQNTLRMLDPQIVNGLQTSRTIYDHYAQQADGTLDDDRHLLLRVIEAADEDASAQVIKATNSQNRVPASSLRAGDSVQKKIEEYFANEGLFYERRRNHYKSLGKRSDQIVEVKELAQALGAILLQRPDDSRARPSAFLDDSVYARIFSESTPLAAYLKCYLLIVRVDEYLQSVGIGSKTARSNVKYHLARSAAAFALTSSRPRAKMLAGIDLAGFTDERLSKALHFVIERRSKVAKRLDVTDESTLAKGKEWIEELNRYFSQTSDKQGWPKKMSAGWAAKGHLP